MTIVPPSVASPDEATRQSRVLIADDHALVRDGLRRIIESEPGLCVCGHAVDGESTLQRLADTPCDVLLLDLTMPAPHGVDLIGRIRTRWPDLPILVLSMHNHIAIVQAVLQAGARGYIVKDSDPEVLLEALRTVVDGGSYLVPKLRHELAALEEAPRLPGLSPREADVLQRLTRGQSNAEIARVLSLSEKTVSTHKANLMAKLHLRSVADLIRYVDDQQRLGAVADHGKDGLSR